MRRILSIALFVSMLAVCNSANAQYPNYGGYQPSAQQQQYQQQGTGKKKGKRNKGEQVQYQQVQQYQQYPQQPQQYQQAPQYQQYPQQPQQYQQAPQYQQYPQQPQQYQQAPQYQQYPQQPQQYQQAPQYQQYPQQPQPQYYQQAQSGFQYQQAPQQSQQYQQVPAQPATSADGFTEVVLSKIEQKALELNTGEIRAYGQGVAANEMLAIRLANAQATNALQAKVETYVRSGLDSYMDQTGVNGEYSIDEKLRDQIIVAAKGFITGVKEVGKAKAYNSQKKLWKYEICVSYDRAGLMEVMVAQSQRILKNEKQFEESMQHAWDALDAQNNRISLGEQQDMRKNDMQQGNLDKQHQRDMQKSAQQNQHDQQMNLQDNQYKLEREKVRANSPHAPQPEQKESQAPVQILNVH